VLVGTVILVLIATAATVKLLFFPSVKDGYFSMSQRALSQVPSGLMVVRPTHFPKSPHTGVIYAKVPGSKDRGWRVMGRNVTFKELMATAYGREIDRVVLPPEMPKTNFDFLVTTSGKQEERLQAIVRKRLGYAAHTETRDQEVLAMKVQDASLPGLKVSDANAKPNVKPENGVLYFTHFHVQEIMQGLEQVLKTPVVDKSDLTNFYDFSIVLDAKVQRQLENNATAPDAIRNILNKWGLTLVPDNDQVEMLIVQRAD
jgi:uncharacterized protein (TIGR03435 family)